MLINALSATGDLDDYYLARSERALELTGQVTERRFLERRLADLSRRLHEE